MGFDIEFLEDEYGVTLEKWFADAQSGAGQYDLYLLDDPWVPQFGAADVLEDLGAGGIDGSDNDWIGSMIDMGYWPPRKGPRVKGFESATPTLISVPFVGDLQTLTYRNDVYTDGAPADLGRGDRQGQGRRRRGQDQIPGRVPRRDRQPDRDELVPGLPVVRRRILRRQVERHLQLRRRARRRPTSSSAR